MKIGFYLKWDIGSLKRAKGNVLGDELYARSLVSSIAELDAEYDIKLYCPTILPSEELDVMIYMNDDKPNLSWAKKSVLYLQNGYGEGADNKLAELRKNHYDGYAFISRKLLALHQKDGFQGIFLPFGVDTDVFNPKAIEEKYVFDAAYVGNDIKGVERTEAYLEPALDFNFGLYGNWKIPKSRFRIWRNWFQSHANYKKKFEAISRGKISQEDLPVLYSSSKINLNCAIEDCVQWDVITLRTLEVLACDGFLISDRVASAEELFGDFIVFTDGHEDLQAKIKYYLEHESERLAMAKSGGEFVRKHFSIKSTALNLLNYCKDL